MIGVITEKISHWAIKLITKIIICLYFYLYCNLYRREEYSNSIRTILEASRATSTVSKYKRAFELWHRWCRDNGLCSLPSSQEDIARYFVHMYNNKAPYSAIETALYAIKWHFDCSPMVFLNPCDQKFLKLLVDGLKRILAKPVKQKEPITTEMLQKVIEKFGGTDNLMHIRMCTLLLVTYAGFFFVMTKSLI